MSVECCKRKKNFIRLNTLYICVRLRVKYTFDLGSKLKYIGTSYTLIHHSENMQTALLIWAN